MGAALDFRQPGVVDFFRLGIGHRINRRLFHHAALSPISRSAAGVDDGNNFPDDRGNFAVVNKIRKLA